VKRRFRREVRLTYLLGGCVLDAATFAAQRLNSAAPIGVRWND